MDHKPAEKDMFSAALSLKRMFAVFILFGNSFFQETSQPEIIRNSVVCLPHIKKGCVSTNAGQQRQQPSEYKLLVINHWSCRPLRVNGFLPYSWSPRDREDRQNKLFVF
jgi:hypothetical protein